MSGRFARMLPSGVLAGCVVLAFVVILGGLVAGWVSWSRHGADGVVAVVVAGLVCFLSSAAALIVTGLTCRGDSRLAGVFAAIALRTGVPLFAGVVISAMVPSLANAGVFGAIVGFYLLTLLFETILSVRLVNAANGVTGVS